MPEWMQEVAASGSDLTLVVITARLLIAALLGVVVAAVYFGSQRRSAGEVFPFLMTMVLLTILVAMTTLVIGNSVARAFGLVGALSIVRFRTVVDDTRDTAFVIFAVVVGMAVGAGYLPVVGIGVPTVAAMALMMHAIGRQLHTDIRETLLEVRVGIGHDPDSLLNEVMDRHVKSRRLKAIVTARQGAALDLQYSIELTQPDLLLPFIRELAQLEGVQNVELKTI